MYSGTVDSPGCPTGEPMNLGSPVGSPNNPGTYGGPQYLPSFLIGDPAGSPMNNSRRWISPETSKSPQKNRSVQSYTPAATTSPSKSLFSPIPANNSLSRIYPHTSPSDKHGGPPIQGLFEYTPSTSSRASLMGGSTSPSQFRNNQTVYASTASSPAKFEAMTGRHNNYPGNNYAPSPAQIDPFYSQGQYLTSEDHLDETWVTVFGFPPAAASYILQQFYHYGTIVEHRLPPSGNWMHIRYQTKLQAKIALSKNGKIFGNYMVGITPCIEKNIILHYANKKATDDLDSLNAQQVLQNGNQSPFSGTEFSVSHPGHFPQKRTGILSKAKDFFFNW